jgi:DNA repair exonuclease SbcCD ATPase subunit
MLFYPACYRLKPADSYNQGIVEKQNLVKYYNNFKNNDIKEQDNDALFRYSVVLAGLLVFLVDLHYSLKDKRQIKKLAETVKDKNLQIDEEGRKMARVSDNLKETSNSLKNAREEIGRLNANIDEFKELELQLRGTIRELELQQEETIRQLELQQEETIRQLELQRQEIERENNRLSQKIKIQADDIIFLSDYVDQQEEMIELLPIAPSEENTWTEIKKMIKSVLHNVLFKRLYGYAAVVTQKRRNSFTALSPENL